MTLILLISQFLIGKLTLDILDPKITKLEKMGLSFIFGSAIHTIIYFILVFKFDSLPINNLILAIFELLILFFISNIRTLKSIPIKGNSKIAPASYLAIIIGLTSFLYITMQSIFWPPYASDAIHLYDFRAQRLLENDKDSFIFAGPYNHSKAYPPFTSLIHFFIYQTDFENPKIFYPILLLAFLMIVCGYTTRKTKSANKAIILCAGILITPVVMWRAFFAHTNIPYMIYFSSACLFLLETKNVSKIILSALLFGFSSFVRSEQFWLVGIIYLLLDLKINTKKIVHLMIFVLILLPFTNIWASEFSGRSPIRQVEKKSTFLFTKDTYSLENIRDVSTFTYEVFKKGWGLLFVILVVTIASDFVFYKNISTSQKTAVIIFTLFPIAILVTSRNLSVWKSQQDAVYRMSSLAIPIFWYSIITSITVNQITKQFNRKL